MKTLDAAETQTALVLTAFAVTLVQTLQELARGSREEALVILQRKAQVEQTRLRQTPNAEKATAMFRFVLDKLRDPEIIAQPED